MTYKHGVYISEVPTSIIPPVRVASGLPVVVGTAPINLGADQSYVNKPMLAYSYAEAVAALGYSDDWEKYTLCEVMKSHFALYNVAPVVFINVLDPAVHKTDVPATDLTLTAGALTIEVDGILLSSLVVKLAAEGSPLVKDTDYTVAFNSSGHVVVTAIEDAGIPAEQETLNIAYSTLDPSAVDSDDIIGGVDGVTGAYTGLELVNKVFPLFRLVPGQILAPGWSQDPDVAAVMKAKASSINGLFKAMALCDIDSSDATGAELYSEAPAWKTTNNYTDPLQVVCWPKIGLGDDTYHLSTQLAGVICKLDGENDDIPYHSPSNKALQCDSAVTAADDRVNLGPENAAYLNGEGIVTALNFIGGWKVWGNRTGAYPGNTDVKDSFIAVRRMFNWVANTLILTYWQNVDNPANRRLIETVVDSVNIWLNGLTARGALLGGRVEFQADENPVTDLLNGIVRFHVYLTPPVPAEDLEFTLEFDVSYLETLFA